MSPRKKTRRPARRRLGDMERYGLLALGAGMILGVGVLTEQLHRDEARQRAQEHPVAVTAGWDWEDGRSDDRGIKASLEDVHPKPGGGEGRGQRNPAPVRMVTPHFDFFEPPVHLPGVKTTVPPPPDATPSGGRMVAVRPGETLQKIALRELGNTNAWPRILQANPGVDPRRLLEGQLLVIPERPLAATSPTGGSRAETSDRTYVVRKRDTLESIAKRHYGTRTRWTDILEANRDRISSPEKLKVGVRIRIPQ